MDDTYYLQHKFYECNYSGGGASFLGRVKIIITHRKDEKSKKKSLLALLALPVKMDTYFLSMALDKVFGTFHDGTEESTEALKTRLRARSA